jgi:hypothetical protein
MAIIPVSPIRYYFIGWIFFQKRSDSFAVPTSFPDTSGYLVPYAVQ